MCLMLILMKSEITGYHRNIPKQQKTFAAGLVWDRPTSQYFPRWFFGVFLFLKNYFLLLLLVLFIFSFVSMLCGM